MEEKIEKEKYGDNNVGKGNTLEEKYRELIKKMVKAHKNFENQKYGELIMQTNKIWWVPLCCTHPTKPHRRAPGKRPVMP